MPGAFAISVAPHALRLHLAHLGSAYACGGSMLDMSQTDIPADQPVAVVPDFMHPAGSSRRLGGEGGYAGFHKSFGKGSMRRHAGEIAVSCAQPQPSCCRGEEDIAPS